MKTTQRILGHIFGTLLLIALSYYYIYLNVDVLIGIFLGISTKIWLILAIISPILHQIYVFVSWHYQLKHQSITSYFGKKQGFRLYKIGFALLILSRPVIITFLAISNQGSLEMGTTLSYSLAILFLIPSAYLFYSVKKYFGIDRAFGIDHFEPEKFRNAPMVKKGIFKYTSNGMYIYGFMMLYLPGLLFFSKAAIMVAVFNHIYIWVHYYFTELPDIKEIYTKQ